MRTFSLLLAAAALTLSGCDGTARGHALSSCTVSADSGECAGSYKAVTGRYTHCVKEVMIAAGAPVALQARFEVQKGELEISMTSPDGKTVKAVAKPGAPAVIEGITTMRGQEELPVVMNAGKDKTVEGVAYALKWHRP